MRVELAKFCGRNVAYVPNSFRQRYFAASYVSINSAAVIKLWTGSEVGSAFISPQTSTSSFPSASSQPHHPASMAAACMRACSPTCDQWVFTTLTVCWRIRSKRTTTVAIRGKSASHPTLPGLAGSRDNHRVSPVRKSKRSAFQKIGHASPPPSASRPTPKAAWLGMRCCRSAY